MRPEVTTVVTKDAVRFFAEYSHLDEKVWIADIPLSDTLEVVAKKTAILLEGLFQIIPEVKPQFLIHDLLDKKGRLKDLKLRKTATGRRWDYVDARGLARSKIYNVGHERADKFYYTQKLLERYSIPEDSCTAILIGALITTMIKIK